MEKLKEAEFKNTAPTFMGSRKRYMSGSTDKDTEGIWAALALTLIVVGVIVAMLRKIG